MRRLGRPTSTTGQVTAEFSLLIGVIAVGCILAILVLMNGIGGLFPDSSPTPSGHSPFQPPKHSPGVNVPTDPEQCLENPGWSNLTNSEGKFFESQADCENYVNAP
jgi:hypothetical protein